MMQKEREDDQLKKISDEYQEAIKVFTTRDYPKAHEAFDKIIEAYKKSEFHSVLEIQTRAKVYKNICDAQINPVEIHIETEEDQINYGILNLNSGHYDKAIELFVELEEQKGKEAYLSYLMSIAYIKKNDLENSMKYLKRCIKRDSFYKIIAFNEPDFNRYFDNEQFRSMVE